jgi:predicted permease
VTWWQRLRRRNKMEDQLEKELRFHLEQHTADLIAQGYEPKAAWRRARLAIGGPEQVKESCRDVRGTRWLEDLFQDVRYALRTLRQRPGFAAVALLTLGLGCGATTVMFTVINGVLLKPLSYPEPDKLVTLHEHTEEFGDQWGFSYLSFLNCKAESRSVAAAGWTYSSGTVSEPGEPENADVRQISADLFPVLGVPLVGGRAFTPEEDQPGGAPVVIISFGLWQRRFAGNANAVGMPLVFDGKARGVVGIAPAGLRLDGEADLFTPLGQATEPRMQNRGAHFLHVVGRLRPGRTMAEARAEMAVITRHRAEEYPEFNEGRDIAALPLQQEVVGPVRSTLWMLLVAVSLVLLIACANVASLLLARAVSRQRELAMRVALGASRSRLARQCLTESGVLGFLGGGLGMALALVGIRPFVVFWPGGLPRADEIQLDWHVLMFAFGASLLSGFLFGLAPVLHVPARELEPALRSGARTVAGSSRRLHAGFVISEIALAVVLLVAAGMLARTLLHSSSLDPGFDLRNVVTARAAVSPGALSSPERTRVAWQDFLDRASRVSGVKSAALVDIVPMREGENILDYRTTAEKPPPNEETVAMASCVTPDYLRVMGIPQRQGRFFDERDSRGSPLVVVIDDSLARHAFGEADAVGQRLWIPSMSSNPVQVIGVVGHVRHWGLAGDDTSPVHDQIYYTFAQVPDRLLHFFSSVMSVAVRTDVAPLSVVESLRREVRRGAGDQVLYEVRTMERLANDSLARERFLMLLLGIFGGLALLLACIGIYGVLAYLTGQRVPEIGVRIALGAGRREVVWLVLRQSLGMIFVGIAVGAVAALAAGRVLQRLVEEMQPAQASTFAVMISLLAAAALLASYVPARRASRIDPITALRQD